METGKYNDYDYSDDERLMISQMRDTLIMLTDKVNTDKIKRADLIASVGAVKTRIGFYVEKLENPKN